MKIVFVIPSLRAGGAERVFANLLSLWDHRLDEVHLVVLSREGVYFDLLPPEVTVHDLGGVRFLQALPRLVRLIRTLRPHAVLGTQAHVNTALGLLKPWLAGARVVGRETSMPTQAHAAKKASALRKLVYGMGYRRLDAVVCPSLAMADDVKALYHVNPGRLTVVPNPVLFDALGQAGRADLDPAFTWLVAVGRFDRAKGFDFLIEALVLLPPRIHLVLVGDGGLRSDLEAMARTRGVFDRILFAGFQKNPHQYVVASRVFVLSSRYEGLPNAALEALGLGVPVAAFDGPWGAREVVVPGLTGVLAQPEDPADLARAIQEALHTTWNTGAIQTWARGRYDGAVVVAGYRRLLV